MEKQSSIGDFMDVTLSKIREMVDVNTIIGSPINTVDGIVIIPVSKVAFGFASGGSDGQKKNSKETNALAGAGGAGVSISPIAFLVIKDGMVRVMNIQAPASTTVDRIVEAAPDLIDKVGAFLKKDGE